MGFFKSWFVKFWFLLKWRFVKAVEIRPFIIVDPNAYCPACGFRSGQIQTVTDGQNTTVRHQCSRCRWIWDEPTVTEIDPKSIPNLMEETEEQEDERYKPRFIRIPPRGEGAMKVNGEELAEAGKKSEKKPATAVL